MPLKNNPILKSFLVFCLVLFGFWLFFKGLDFALQRSPEPIGSHADLFSEGARTSLILTFIASLAGIILGTIGAAARLSRFAAVRLPIQFISWLIRGTPLMVQILFVYYALPGLLPQLKLGEFSAACIALSLNISAYNADTIRAGLEAIPKGQTEAAVSLGLSRFQTFLKVIFPQAFQIMIPPLVNNTIALLKDSSLASAIGLVELTLAGSRISSETFLPVPVLTTVAGVYLALTTAITLALAAWKRAQA